MTATANATTSSAYRLEAEDSVFALSQPQRDAVLETGQRLRSWALILGQKIGGQSYLALPHEGEPQVHLPLQVAADPHPETGVHAYRRDEGSYVRFEDVAFAELADMLAGAEQDLASRLDAARAAEFHPDDADFKRGTLYVPVA